MIVLESNLKKLTSNVVVDMKQLEQRDLFNLGAQNYCWAIIQLIVTTLKAYIIGSAKRLTGARIYQQPNKKLLLKINLEAEHLP